MSWVLLAALAHGLPTSPTPWGHDLSVSVLTFGQGDRIFEAGGHTGIRIRDPRHATDTVYNWGVFDHTQPGFTLPFLAGRIQYSMRAVPTHQYLLKYTAQNRDVWEQDLSLTPGERMALLNLVITNSRPENRNYLYRVLDDNCSTRVRDALDAATHGALAHAMVGLPESPTRFHTRRLSQPQPQLWLGFDLLLGVEGDKVRDRWDAANTPLVFMESLRLVHRGGVPLVTAERQLHAAERRPPAPRPRLLWPPLALGGALSAGLVALADRDRPALAWLRAGLVVTWSLLAGLVGLVLLGVWFTEHVEFQRNANALLFTPLSLLLVAGPAASRRLPGLVSGVSAGLAGLAVLGGLVGLVLGQHNGEWLALAVPVHLAVAWVLREHHTG